MPKIICVAPSENKSAYYTVPKNMARDDTNYAFNLGVEQYISKIKLMIIFSIRIPSIQHKKNGNKPKEYIYVKYRYSYYYYYYYYTLNWSLRVQ